MDYTETDAFADSIIDLYCQPTAQVGKQGGLLYGLVRSRKISPGPAFRREYQRVAMLEEENERLRKELEKPKADCRITIQSFAKLCGVSERTVKGWNSGGKIYTVFDSVAQRDISYSPKLLENSEAAARWAAAFHERKRIKRMERQRATYREGVAVKSRWYN